MDDSAVIKTSYGYHIVIFKGYGDLGWRYDTYIALQEADYYELVEDALAKNTVSYAENHRDFVGNN